MSPTPRRSSAFPIVLIFAALLALAIALGIPDSHQHSPAPAARGIAPPPASSPGCTPEQQAQVAKGNGKLGVCAPRPRPGAPLGVIPSGGASGPDTSNNDPLYDWRPVRARGHVFGWAKINQGAWFTDRTAPAQLAAVHAAHLAAGGYDFYEVCVGSGRAEALFFLRLLDRTSAKGPGELPAAGDAEWPLSPRCSAGGARRWIAEWVGTVYAHTHRPVVLYTGAWWWNPHVGCWWPAHALSWISGYGVSYPYMPCSLHRLDFWQFSSSYPITRTLAGDMSVWRHTSGAFRQLVHPGPSPAARRRAREHAERRELRKLIGEREHTRRHLLNAGCRVKHPRRACLPLRKHGSQVKAEIAALEARLHAH